MTLTEAIAVYLVYKDQIPSERNHVRAAIDESWRVLYEEAKTIAICFQAAEDKK